MGSLTKWFVFTIAFGLLPFGCALLLQQFEHPGAATAENSAELLFFSIMVCAGGLGEMSSFKERRGWRKPFLGTSYGVLLVGAIVSAVVFGVYSDHARKSPGAESGLDCAAYLQLTPVARARTFAPGAALEDVGAHCARWEEVQTHIFRFSIGLAILFGVTSTVAQLVLLSSEER